MSPGGIRGLEREREMKNFVWCWENESLKSSRTEGSEAVHIQREKERELKRKIKKSGKMRKRIKKRKEK